MPYSGASDPDLPSYVKDKPKKTIERWIKIFESALHQYDGDESRAFAIANGVVLKNKGLVPNVEDVDIRQVSMDSAEYDPLGASKTEGCANCNWFVPSGDACILVSGDIVPTGYCKYWLTKEMHTPEPIPVKIVKSMKSIFDSIFTFSGNSPNPAVQGGLRFYRKNDGDPLRFFTVVSSCFVDKEGPKGIIQKSAHKEYVDWVYETKNFPELWIWHSKGSRWGVVDWIEFDGSFLVESGIIDKEKEYIAKALSKLDIGVSHGFLAAENPDGYITKYRSFEISVLPRPNAAMPWSDFNIMGGKDVAFSDKKKSWLKELGVDESQIVSWEKETQDLEQQLKSLGIQYKGDDGASTAEEIKSLISAVRELSDKVAQNEKVTLTTAEATAALSKSIDDRVAGVFAAEISKLPQGFRASESSDNVVKGEKGSVDKDEWFSTIVLKGLGV